MFSLVSKKKVIVVERERGGVGVCYPSGDGSEGKIWMASVDFIQLERSSNNAPRETYPGPQK